MDTSKDYYEMIIYDQAYGRVDTNNQVMLPNVIFLPRPYKTEKKFLKKKEF